MNSYMLSDRTLKHWASSKTITNIVIRYSPIYHTASRSWMANRWPVTSFLSLLSQPIFYYNCINSG